MAVQVGIGKDGGISATHVPEHLERERRLLMTARRRRLARLRRRAETAAWVIGLMTLAGLALSGLVGLR